MTGRVAGKVIIVTGGAGGLGLAISRLLAAQEASVGVIDIDEGAAREASSALAAAGARSIGIGADVCDWKAASGAVACVEGMLGEIDGLINNAGVAHLGSVHDTDEQCWRRVLDVNVNGVFQASRAVLAGMMDRRRGVILNVASIAGLVGIHRMAAYCASKGAVISLTRQMAVDYATFGIRVNAIAPGTIASTEMGKRLLQSDDTPEAQARRLFKYPMGRYAREEEIASAALFLMSDESSFVTGSVLTVDGGMTAL
jgi:NAD(P)-dependent dehydrogenase (short-subunit alcohol dehydrogenase family)